jgi:hypothetical protein
MSRRELIVLSKRKAAQSRGLEAAREKAAAKDATFKRIFRGTGDAGAREFHRITAPSFGTGIEAEAVTRSGGDAARGHARADLAAYSEPAVFTWSRAARSPLANSVAFPSCQKCM